MTNAAQPTVGEAVAADPELSALRRTLEEAEKQAQAIGSHAEGTSWWSTQNAMTMSATILLFGAVVIAIAAFTTRHKLDTVDSVLRLYGTIMVITMAGFLVVAGYNDTQIAAPLGLLGTVAGYLLGRESSKGGDRGG